METPACGSEPTLLQTSGQEGFSTLCSLCPQSRTTQVTNQVALNSELACCSDSQNSLRTAPETLELNIPVRHLLIAYMLFGAVSESFEEAPTTADKEQRHQRWVDGGLSLIGKTPPEIQAATLPLIADKAIHFASWGYERIGLGIIKPLVVSHPVMTVTALVLGMGTIYVVRHRKTQATVQKEETSCKQVACPYQISHLTTPSVSVGWNSYDNSQTCTQDNQSHPPAIQRYW